ncbi:hypothetical protein L6452_18907 [Arctium lappa]|uniref:Uncharacterized protein n=1 Tax=Arctium lappa TaxID=4217 RepID=A0ACB9B8G8_ARCLA|nr:hypothetical protein L6452_18907 [Arctium lappa]
MRRRAGIGGLQNAAAARVTINFPSFLLAYDQVKNRSYEGAASTFRSQLEDFARKHKNDIRKNPAFRSQFHEMCAKVGVDPLASNKGFWVELLGIGDFYYELGRCLFLLLLLCYEATPQLETLPYPVSDIPTPTVKSSIGIFHIPHNGGLINLEELCKLLSQRRKGAREVVCEDDCLCAISKLKVLGSGFEVITVGKRKLVRSVPTGLKKDHNEILELSQQYATLKKQVSREAYFVAFKGGDSTVIPPEILTGQKRHNLLRCSQVPTQDVGSLSPEKAIPNSILKKAKGLAIFTVAKVGMMVTYNVGTGIEKTDLGLHHLPFLHLVGGEVTDFIIVLRNSDAVRTFGENAHLSVGAGASAAACIIRRTVEADFRAGDGGYAACYTYSCSKGAFVGCSLEGSMVTTRMQENCRFYGNPSIKTSDILLGLLPRPPTAAILYDALSKLYMQVEGR